MKKVLFVLIIALILVLSAAAVLIKVKIVNNWRLKKGSSLEQQASDTTDQDQKLTFLIQSNFLSPNSSKKLQISNLYLRRNNYFLAEQYLLGVRDQEGYLRLAEANLEQGDKKAADLFLGKLNQKNQVELNIFKNFDQGNYDSARDIPTDPITNLGKLIKVINSNVFEENKVNSILGNKIEGLKTQYPTKIKLRLEIAKMMGEESHPNLARFVLNELEEETGELKDITQLRAKTYEFENNYSKALEEEKNLILIDPSDVSSYQLALTYAQKAKDEVQINYLNDQIKLLEKIEK